MTTGTYTGGVDYYNGANIQHGDTQAQFRLTGGLYALTAIAGTWNSGSLDLQIIAPDGSTFVSVLSAVVSANKFQTLDLPAGQYKFVVTTTDGIYATISRISRGAGA